MQLELVYPHRAGAKEETTSREAAQRLERSGKAEALRERVLFCLRRPATSKELAESMGEDLLSVRPRLSELKARGLIESTGARRGGEHEWAKV